MAVELAIFAGAVILLSVIAILMMLLNSYSRRRRLGVISADAMLDVALDVDSSLHYADLRFVHNSQRFTIDHLIITENNVFAINAIDIIGDNSVTSKAIVRNFCGVKVNMGSPQLELSDAVSALGDHLGLRNSEVRNITQLVVLTGDGLVREDHCPGNVIYVENLITAMSDIEEQTKNPVLTPKRIFEAVFPSLGEPEGGLVLSGFEKMRYSDVQVIADRARQLGFAADGFNGVAKTNYIKYAIRWFKENF